ncbi:hypothetical protein CHELA40_13400 [Chelatococcus asaccharovorans]|nr:hypothetical protein CHELA40_13400 [Chelatococcus asaccharovorans]CAH1678266.1 hypothetical protein CHELA17_62217 [Chelatococcus asaccharovorans]
MMFEVKRHAYAADGTYRIISERRDGVAGGSGAPSDFGRVVAQVSALPTDGRATRLLPALFIGRAPSAVPGKPIQGRISSGQTASRIRPI